MGRSLFGAIAFYTCIPIPHTWTEFTIIARFAVLIGLLIGGILGLIDYSLTFLQIPILTRSALTIISGIIITGGLHLDGVIDTGDGLGVQDENRRLEVMSDSKTGAFGVIAGICLIILKICALSELNNYRWVILILACGWGRWGQIIAIAFYPYLKISGKGAFHKEAIRNIDVILGLGLMLTISGLMGYVINKFIIVLITSIIGIAIAVIIPNWFNHKLGGHTGDTYGAVVEWTEALLLCIISSKAFNL